MDGGDIELGEAQFAGHVHGGDHGLMRAARVGANGEGTAIVARLFQQRGALFDRERATRMARALDYGTVYMNRCDALDPALPWTGVKDSGRGVTLSALGFDALTRPKAIHFRLAL